MTEPFFGDDTTPPNIVDWPQDRDELIVAVWQAGVASGRLLQVEDEVKASIACTEARIAAFIAALEAAKGAGE